MQLPLLSHWHNYCARTTHIRNKDFSGKLLFFCLQKAHILNFYLLSTKKQYTGKIKALQKIFANITGVGYIINRIAPYSLNVRANSANLFVTSPFNLLRLPYTMQIID